MKKLIQAGVILSLSLMLCFSQTVPADAESNDYIIEDSRRIPIPESYVFREIITDFTGPEDEPVMLNAAEDIFINSRDFIYIADTGNNRVLKLTPEGKIDKVYRGPSDKPLFSPQGIYADNEGNLYIADTGNERLVHLSSDGEFVEEFILPDSSILGESFTFDVTKICLNNTGYIYAVKGQNIMVLDAFNRFRGFLGQSEIGFSFVDFFLRIVASDEQKKAISKRLAAAYTNISVGRDGAIYATSLDPIYGEIKKLNSVGLNIYPKGTEGFGEKRTEDMKDTKPYFIDLAVDDYGIVAALEGNTGKIYVYDTEGNLLCVFGGIGEQKGKFQNPSSIAINSQGDLFIIDRDMNSVQVFEATKFINLVKEAVTLYANGEYPKAYDVWKEVLAIDENYRLAHTGLAKVLLKQGAFYEAMTEYMLANDAEGYSEAFGEYRHLLIRKHFTVFAVVLILTALLLWGLIVLIRKSGENALYKFRASAPNKCTLTNMLKLSIAIIFHPLETLEFIRNARGQYNPLPGLLILSAASVSRLLYLYTVHWPLADVDPKEANIWIELGTTAIPVLTWILAVYAVTSVMGGEANILELFTASIYCLSPYILSTLLLGLLSNIISSNESMLYEFLRVASIIWVLLLLFTSHMVLNNFSFRKTTGTTILSLAAMGITWVVILLVAVTIGQFTGFITGIFREIQTMT